MDEIAERFDKIVIECFYVFASHYHECNTKKLMPLFLDDYKNAKKITLKCI